jgi:succinate dehydrogenase/fumarate reductase flavoprotein subunit
VEETFDVVVCGFGGAGAAAAIEAHDRGARVLVVEKADEAGGSTQESGGSVATIVDRAGAVEHYLALTEGRTPRAVVEAYVAGVLELEGWLADNGGSLEPLPMHRPPFPHRYQGTAYANKPRSDAIGPRVRVAEDGVDHGGTSLWHLLDRSVRSRAIDVRHRTQAARLLEGRDGVTGVVLEGPGGAVDARATGGVVLTCGGFGCNPEMLDDAVGPGLSHLAPPGRNTGEGVRMAQAVGADLWHMNCIAAGFGYQVPGVAAAWMCSIPAFGFFLVDRLGRRFLDEPTVEHHAAGHALMVRDFRTGEFWRVPSYLIFDEKTRLAGRIATVEAGHNRRLAWSEDNSDEIAKGWIKRADTLDALARELGLPPDALDETGARYDAAARSGHDEMGRSPSTMVPLDHPPYYGIEVRPSLFNTQGGPRRDELGRVVAVGGEPIPGLFSAGELGSMWAALYPGAGNVTEALVSGRIAGRSAATRSITPGT